MYTDYFKTKQVVYCYFYIKFYYELIEPLVLFFLQPSNGIIDPDMGRVSYQRNGVRRKDAINNS